MFVRIIKTIVIGGVVYYTGRKAKAQAKLLIVRAEAKAEMNRIEGIMKQIFQQEGEFALMPKTQREDLFDRYLDQLKRVTKIHAKTL